MGHMILILIIDWVLHFVSRSQLHSTMKGRVKAPRFPESFNHWIWTVKSAVHPYLYHVFAFAFYPYGILNMESKSLAAFRYYCRFMITSSSLPSCLCSSGTWITTLYGRGRLLQCVASKSSCTPSRWVIQCLHIHKHLFSSSFMSFTSLTLNPRPNSEILKHLVWFTPMFTVHVFFLFSSFLSWMGNEMFRFMEFKDELEDLACETSL